MTDGVRNAALAARRSARVLGTLAAEERNRALEAMAQAIDGSRERIGGANREDLARAEVEVRSGRMSPSLVKRLDFGPSKIDVAVDGIRKVGRLEDPLGRVLWGMELDDRLRLLRVSCPIGVLGVIFESRPDVVPQITALAVKSGNAVILKGGTEARRTNEVIFEVIRGAVTAIPRFPAGAVHLLHTREDVGALLDCRDEVDLVIPRGSKELVGSIMKGTRIPVLGHTEGVCHVYVHRAADPEKAKRVVLDSKTDYPAACNAAETLLMDAGAAPALLGSIVETLRASGIEVRGCARSRAIVADLVPATDEDFGREYLDLIIAVKVVDGIEDAIEHIHRHGSGHTDAIVTEDADAAETFLARVDSAGVYHNASTRFADGYRYGLGAEVGISTNRVHARGPVGLEGLTTYRYLLRGDGQAAADYGPGKRPFRHRPIAPGAG